MRPVTACLVALLLAGSCAFAAPNRLTIVMSFEGDHSTRAIGAMQRELESIMKDAGLSFDWRTREQMDGADASHLIMVRFKGACVMEPVPYLMDERGPLALTRSVDGAVLPFSEVACDRVRSSVQSAMWGGDYARGDLLLGRALGRVLAHELYHILSRSGAHAPSGVARAALSGKQLVSSGLGLRPADLERLHPAR